jgi:glutamine cyclotransferase
MGEPEQRLDDHEEMRALRVATGLKTRHYNGDDVEELGSRGCCRMNQRRTSRSLPRGHAVLAMLLAFCLAGCVSTQGENARRSTVSAAAAGENSQAAPVLGVEVIKSYPHDPHAFTQGLEYYDGYLYESTGRSGQSTLRRTVLETGAVLNQVSLPPEYFGEGLTIFRGKIYQLTWLSKIGFIYDVRTFRRVGEFRYESEGWGLTHDDASLILSDGSNKLQFIDPASFKTVRTLEVYAGNVAITNLNELEYINGEIFANVWHSSRIGRIDPRSGQVLAWIDLTSVVARSKHEPEDVLNGIAYDAKRRRLFVTGKDWAEILEIKIDTQPNER